jgi:hypothetical protein
MNSKYISVTIENFQQDTRLCTLSLTNKLSGILLFKIEDNSVIRTIGEILKEMPNYHFQNNKISTDNFRFICNTSENVICSTIFEQIQKRNQEIIKEQENCPKKIDWNQKITETSWNNNFTSFNFGTQDNEKITQTSFNFGTQDEKNSNWKWGGQTGIWKQQESGTQTETSSVVLSNELVVLHNNIVPNVPCNTPITIKDIQNDLNKLESPTSSMEVFHTIDSIDSINLKLVKTPVKQHTSSSGNESESESESDSSSDESENGTYTTLENQKPKRRKRSVRTLCVIDSSSSDDEDETEQPSWNECIMEILDECPKTAQKIGDIMSMRFPKKMVGKTFSHTINERCQSLVEDGRAQRMKSENNRFKYFV